MIDFESFLKEAKEKIDSGEKIINRIKEIKKITDKLSVNKKFAINLMDLYYVDNSFYNFFSERNLDFFERMSNPKIWEEEPYKKILEKANKILNEGVSPEKAMNIIKIFRGEKINDR